MEIPELYHPDILTLAQNPSRWREVHAAHSIIKAYNPVCGDKFEIRIDYKAEQVIEDVSFFGYGCVVSKASAALLTELLIGLTPDEVRSLLETHRSAVLEKEANAGIDIRFKPFLAVRDYPGRIQCVLLGWEALLKHQL